MAFAPAAENADGQSPALARAGSSPHCPEPGAGRPVGICPPGTGSSCSLGKRSKSRRYCHLLDALCWNFFSADSNWDDPFGWARLKPCCIPCCWELFPRCNSSFDPNPSPFMEEFGLGAQQPVAPWRTHPRATFPGGLTLSPCPALSSH